MREERKRAASKLDINNSEYRQPLYRGQDQRGRAGLQETPNRRAGTGDRNAQSHRSRKRKRRYRKGYLLLWPALCLVLILGGILLINYEEWRRSLIDKSEIQVPDWIRQDFLTPNPYSRPQDPLETVHGIAIHYVANKNTTAKNNRDYFENLKNTREREASSHFIIGLDGEVIQALPLTEIAYAVKHRNRDTISIECCHPDETGEFSEATYQSLIRLTAWLCQEFRLDEHDVIRHYDITGKPCPLFYVEHEDAWRAFLRDVKLALKNLHS